MIVKIKLIVLAILLLSSVISAADINGRFVVSNTDSSKLAVKLQINTLAGTTALGGATIVFGFDTTTISLNNNPVNNVDYIYHNFYGGYYSPATVTRPLKNRVWINIDLPYNNNNHGTLVSDTSGWTDVVTIYFDITNNNGAASLYWISTSPFWSIYKDDNLTLLSPSSFQNITYNLIPVEVKTDFTLKEFTLSQNYPNPFNPSTIIRWQCPIATHQTLKVYDILGNEVATLVDEYKLAGTYEVDFNTASIGEGLASGIYIYRLQTSDFTETRKMVLLR